VNQAVAIGYGSVANVVSTVSVGSGNIKRRIMNVAPGVAANDAVTVAQLQAATSAMAQAQPAVAATAAPDTASIIAELRREVSELRARLQRVEQLAER
jgi:autotransporter adhesin